jgi:hypothetical protein
VSQLVDSLFAEEFEVGVRVKGGRQLSDMTERPKVA